MLLLQYEHSQTLSPKHAVLLLCCDSEWLALRALLCPFIIRFLNRTKEETKPQQSSMDARRGKASQKLCVLGHAARYSRL